MFDVVSIGGATVDVFLDTDIHEHFIGKKQEVCYPLGEKIKVEKVDIFTGGGGTNTAVAFSRFGLKTGYIGKIGGDNYGGMIYNEIVREKVKFMGKVSKQDKTDFSIILDSKRHDDRTILNYKDASSKLRYDEVKSHINTKWFYFSSVLGESFQTMKQVAIAARGRVNIGFNASSYLAEKGVEYLYDVLKSTNVFVLNKEEAEILVGKDKVEKMLVKIAKAGPGIVCITDGRNGSYTYDGNLVYYQKSHKVKVVEKTGAGDAYAATLVAGIIRGLGIEKALGMALANAESVIQHKGAKNILLSWDEAIKSNSSIVKKRL